MLSSASFFAEVTRDGIWLCELYEWNDANFKGYVNAIPKLEEQNEGQGGKLMASDEPAGMGDAQGDHDVGDEMDEMGQVAIEWFFTLSGSGSWLWDRDCLGS